MQTTFWSLGHAIHRACAFFLMIGLSCRVSCCSGNIGIYRNLVTKLLKVAKSRLVHRPSIGWQCKIHNMSKNSDIDLGICVWVTSAFIQWLWALWPAMEKINQRSIGKTCYVTNKRLIFCWAVKKNNFLITAMISWHLHNPVCQMWTIAYISVHKNTFLFTKLSPQQNVATTMAKSSQKLML